MDEMLDYLKENNFDKQLEKLNKKLKNKSIIIYGTGILFQKIKENYNLENLNIIAVSDRKYSNSDEGKEEFGYKIAPLDKIESYKPDYVLIGAKNFLGIMDEFINERFKNTKIKVLPLVDRPFLELLKGIFS